MFRRARVVMMGLRMRWYWLCEWLWNSAFVLILNMMFVIGGTAGGIPFIERSAGMFTLLMVLWSQCLVVMAMLASSLYSRLITSYISNFLGVVLFCEVLFDEDIVLTTILLTLGVYCPLVPKLLQALC